MLPFNLQVTDLDCVPSVPQTLEHELHADIVQLPTTAGVGVGVGVGQASILHDSDVAGCEAVEQNDASCVFDDASTHVTVRV